MRSRRGVTLVEIAIVVAIIGVLAAIGAALLTELIPSWRTRRAALEFTTQVNQARAMAVADNHQYRIWITGTDSDPSGDDTNMGEYWIQKGNEASNSTAWDTLPVEMSGEDTLQGEGYVNLAKDAQDELPGVSILTPDTALVGDGTWSDSIIFSPRGLLDNSAEDFNCDVNGDGGSDGYICVTFTNKTKAQAGGEDSWTVTISRAGFARMHHGAAAEGYSAGVSNTSTMGTNPSGYGGGTASSDDESSSSSGGSDAVDEATSGLDLPI